jgi:hypothetical protein
VRNGFKSSVLDYFSQMDLRIFLYLVVSPNFILILFKIVNTNLKLLGNFKTNPIQVPKNVKSEKDAFSKSKFYQGLSIGTP